MKQCNLCGQFKDESQYARRSDDRANGLQAHCLDCQAQKNRRYYREHAEEIRLRSLARKRAIKAGTYRPSKSTHSGYKRRPELPKPGPPRQVVGFGCDTHEYTFLEAQAMRRGVSMETVLRELIRAAMAARQAEENPEKKT